MITKEMFLADADILARIGRLMGDGADEQDIRFYGQTAFTLVCDYCAVDSVEEGLCPLICMMAADLRLHEQMAHGVGQRDGCLKNVRRGDTALTYATPAATSVRFLKSPTFLVDYQKRLDMYRKLRW